MRKLPQMACRVAASVRQQQLAAALQACSRCDAAVRQNIWAEGCCGGCLQLEAAAAVAREDKRKGEAALEAAEARYAAREALMKEKWDRYACQLAPSTQCAGQLYTRCACGYINASPH